MNDLGEKSLLWLLPRPGKVMSLPYNFASFLSKEGAIQRKKAVVLRAGSEQNQNQGYPPLTITQKTARGRDAEWVVQGGARLSGQAFQENGFRPTASTHLFWSLFSLCQSFGQHDAGLASPHPDPGLHLPPFVRGGRRAEHRLAK